MIEENFFTMLFNKYERYQKKKGKKGLTSPVNKDLDRYEGGRSFHCCQANRVIDNKKGEGH